MPEGSANHPAPNRPRRHVPRAIYWQTRFFDATERFWTMLAQLESTVLGDELRRRKIDRPIYVAGVARSGTTIVTEMLAGHPDVTSHRYSDFPNIHTPYWRNWLADRIGRSRPQATERAHRDRLMVTAESPEAVEEVLWMQFFDHLHDPSLCHVLDDSTSNPKFESFYRDHIRKLLLVRGRSRYLTKGNYNITRLGYLRKLFPDARFVVPVRNPVNHVASLVKQDRLFERLAGEDPRVAEQLRRSGHFEFGPGKRCINVGDPDEARAIQAHWAEGRAVLGWAMYWNAVYRHLLDALERDPELAEAVLPVRYEALCSESGPVIDRIVSHCRLSAEPFEVVRREYIDRISEPDYYRPDFTPAEESDLRAVTRETAEAFGY